MYGKTFSSLWEGSMVGQPDMQLVFIFLFCHCDRHGYVEAHPAVIAAKTGLDLGRVESALAALQEPDPRSRSKTEEGKRIVAVDDDHIVGWHVVNYEYYRGLRRADDRRAYHRDYWHKRKKLNATQPRATARNPTQPIAEADAEAYTKDFGRPISRPRHDPASFERFWSKYPKKRCRAEACAEWDRLRPDKALLLEMSVSLERYVKETEVKYLLDPNRWLKRRRWEDEAVEQAPNDIEREAVKRQIADRRAQYERWAREAEAGVK